MALPSTIWFIRCLCAQQQPQTPSYFNTLAPINKLNLLSEGEQCGCVLQRAASGSCRERFLPCLLPTSAPSVVLHQSLRQCRSAGQRVDLIFDVLDGGQLGHSFLDPQSSESSRRVGVPALSHQFAHHTQSLENHQGHSVFY